MTTASENGQTDRKSSNEGMFQNMFSNTGFLAAAFAIMIFISLVIGYVIGRLVELNAFWDNFIINGWVRGAAFILLSISSLIAGVTKPDRNGFYNSRFKFAFLIGVAIIIASSLVSGAALIRSTTTTTTIAHDAKTELDRVVSSFEESKDHQSWRVEGRGIDINSLSTIIGTFSHTGVQSWVVSAYMDPRSDSSINFIGNLKSNRFPKLAIARIYIPANTVQISNFHAQLFIAGVVARNADV